MKQYFISKTEYKGDVVFVNCDKNIGYKLNPKNNIPYDGIKVNEMVIVKPDMIQKIIKKKIKKKLEFYLSFIIEEDDSDTRIALGDLQRYRRFVNDKYKMFLDEKYMTLLNNKFDILERNMKGKIISNLDKSKYVEETHTRSR